VTDATTNSLLYDRLRSALSKICPWVRLKAASMRLGSDYENPKPYPHIVIDGRYDTAVLEHICAAFPKPEDRIVWNTANEHKSSSRSARGVTAEALHGHSAPLTCPPDRRRQLISIYYWNDLM